MGNDSMSTTNRTNKRTSLPHSHPLASSPTESRECPWTPIIRRHRTVTGTSRQCRHSSHPPPPGPSLIGPPSPPPPAPTSPTPSPTVAAPDPSLPLPAPIAGAALPAAPVRAATPKPTVPWRPPRDAQTPSTAAAPAAVPPVPDRKSPPASAPTLRWSCLVSAAVGHSALLRLLPPHELLPARPGSPSAGKIILTHSSCSSYNNANNLTAARSCQGQLAAATAKLQSGIIVMYSSLDMSIMFSYQSDSSSSSMPSRSLKNFSLLLSLSALYAPIVVLKYIDLLSKLRRPMI
ncbi:hypothetical protein QYE76_060070 [Lolium multiflorum]|uniref:Uncharacterized protein n=1 Tax=Lolium multiflorum TaxID=4521 RepID=A0AAD8RZA0_LOLMU|nr:hypothetical protein QYE76_060070 [Lolium multiflorum]